MLDAGRAFMLIAPYLTMAPGLAIGLAILGFNLLGDGLAQLAGPVPRARLPRRAPRILSGFGFDVLDNSPRSDPNG
jgi:hypothetical protein